MRFSEREGYKNIKENALESMDSSLKNALWTIVYTHINQDYVSYGTTGYGDDTYRDSRAKNLWTKFFNQTISKLPRPVDFLEEIEHLYEKLKWYDIYDLVEFLIKQNAEPREFNDALIEQNSAYRIINSLVQPISNPEVINAMESANNNALGQEVRIHLNNAQRLYSIKQKPDFNNSCLESIKAVEAACRIVLSNEKILGENIKEFKNTKKHNQHIIAILEKLNAFRNDVVAHATKQDSYSTTREDAILIHVLCCGFINYFKSKR